MNQYHFVTNIWDALKRGCKPNEIIFEQFQEMFESHISAGATEKLKCVERYCELANKKTEQLYNVSSPCLDDHQIKKKELESVGELSQVCSQIVLKCLYLARIGRPHIQW